VGAVRGALVGLLAGGLVLAGIGGQLAPFSAPLGIMSVV